MVQLFENSQCAEYLLILSMYSPGGCKLQQRHGYPKQEDTPEIPELMGARCKQRGPAASSGSKACNDLVSPCSGLRPGASVFGTESGLGSQPPGSEVFT